MFDFVISDTHFFHKNIVEYAGRPKNHDWLMVENWRKTVPAYNATVLHLGDVLMGQQEKWPTVGWLPGFVSVLDSGNHDEPHKRQFLEQERGWLFIREFSMEYRGYAIYFTHRPLWVTYPDPNDNTAVKIDSYLPPLSINVHGHIHEKLAPSRFHVNVCVEQINYTPINLKELLDRRIDELA